jgi:hypothetical protein
MTLWKCPSSWHTCEGVSEMYLNMHLLRSLMKRRGLLGMGLGVYWAIVLAASFRTHGGNELGDREMMKCVGGQSPNNGTCTQRGICSNQSCTLCPTVGKPCSDNEQVGFTAQACVKGGGYATCNTTGANIRMLCNNFFGCDCTMQGCVPQTTVKSQQCISDDVGNPACIFTAAPPGC